MKTEEELIDEFFNCSYGELTITVHGMDVDRKGEINKGGAIMAAYSLLKTVSDNEGRTFCETLDFMNDLSTIFSSEMTGKITRKKKNGRKDN